MSKLSLNKDDFYTKISDLLISAKKAVEQFDQKRKDYEAIKADQAYNSFSAFSEDALVRLKPIEIKKNGKVPINGSVFFTIFQPFMWWTRKSIEKSLISD